MRARWRPSRRRATVAQDRVDLWQSARWRWALLDSLTPRDRSERPDRGQALLSIRDRCATAAGRDLQWAMMTGPPDLGVGDLVPLLYRARWTRFSLSGEVRSRVTRPGLNDREELSGTVLAAPGGRFRAEVVDEDGDRELTICDGASGGIPFPELLDPSQLLPDYDLRVTGRAEYLGRAAYAVEGSPRLAGGRQPRAGHAGAPAERVSALVDAEMGILLRYEKSSPWWTQAAEFTRLTVDAGEAADPGLFACPPDCGRDPGGSRPGGLRSWRPPAPGDARPSLSDDAVNLLYRSLLGPQRFSAEIHERVDNEEMLRLAGTTFASTSLGRRTRWLWHPPEDYAPENIDQAARLQVAMPGRYRIDARTDPGTRPTCIACDGEHLWRVYPDRVAVRPAEPPPTGITLIIDPAWLLNARYNLSAVTDSTVDGRPALRVSASGGPSFPDRGPLSGSVVISDHVEAFIDVDLGIILRQVLYYQGHPVLRAELSSVTTDVDPAVFRIEPPPGTPVIAGGLLAEAGLTPAGAAVMLAKGASRLAFDLSRRWLRH